MAGLGLWMGLARSTGGGGGSGPVGEIILSGTDFTATDIATGLMGAFNFATAGRISFPPGNNSSVPGALVFDFIAPGATIVMFQGASQPTGMVEVSVDGGAFASAGAASGGKYTIATGLSDTLHTAIVRVNSAYGVSGYIPDTGNVLGLVGGATPTVILPRAMQMETSGLSILESACAFGDAPSGLSLKTPAGNQTPGRVPNIASPTGQRNASSFRIKTNATELWSYGEDNYCWIHDGTTTTRYALNGAGPGALGARLTKLTGFSGLKEYSIWTQGRSNQVIAPYDGEFSTLGTVGRFDEYGDSICEFSSGNGAIDRGFAAVYQTAVALGRIGGNFGVSGNTIANLRTRIDLLLANKEVTSFDVAFLTIGRNNIGGAFDATETTDYQYIVSALLTKGYGRIICRGLLPEGANLWPAESGSISSIVTGYADPKIVFCDASTYTGIGTHDGTHLTVAGANTLTAYQVAALPALIGTL